MASGDLSWAAKCLPSSSIRAAIAAAMSEEGKHFAAQLKSPEAKEAFAAFAEKRAPDFSRKLSGVA